MKVPNHSLFAVLLATTLTVGCTVNIQTRPDAEPGPEPAESEPDVGQVEPTNRRERDRAQPIPEPRRRADDETIVRRSEPPRQEPETKAKPDTTKDETKETGRREKEDTGTTQPDTNATLDPPDRPGVGKGRKESQETYPGKGKATGLEKQQDKDPEPANQGNAKGRNKQPDVKSDPGVTREPTPGMKSDEKTGRDKPKDDRVSVNQPESNKDAAGKEQPPSANKPDQKPDKDTSVKEPVAAKQSAPDKQPDRKSVNDERGSDPDKAKQKDIKNDSAVTKQETPEEKPDKSNKADDAQRKVPESQSDAPASKDSEPETDGDEASPPARLGIQSKYLPSPGRCRVWIPGDPAGDQAEPSDCDGIESTAPPGSWVVYRPENDRKVVYVRQMHQRRRGAITSVWIYEASSGKYLGQEGTE